MNLTRDLRNGRNFEYYGEDPWHSAIMAAEQVNGIQSQQVISTVKHYTLNANETNRHWLDASSTPQPIANRICSPFRSPSNVRSPARS